MATVKPRKRKKANPGAGVAADVCAWCGFKVAADGSRVGAAKLTAEQLEVLAGQGMISHGICTVCRQREFPDLPKRKPNPSELKKAVALSRKFHGFEPRRIKAAVIRWPKALAHLGACVSVDYLCDKFDGQQRRYFHEFTGRCDVFAAPRAMPDGDSILIIKGNFKILAEGITG